MKWERWKMILSIFHWRLNVRNTHNVQWSRLLLLVNDDTDWQMIHLSIKMPSTALQKRMLPSFCSKRHTSMTKMMGTNMMRVKDIVFYHLRHLCCHANFRMDKLCTVISNIYIISAFSIVTKRIRYRNLSSRSNDLGLWNATKHRKLH